MLKVQQGGLKTPIFLNLKSNSAKKLSFRKIGAKQNDEIDQYLHHA